MGKTYDFSGWATRNDLRCADGRIIRRNAFQDNDGKTVPLVWNHNHSEVTNVIGHALLENRDEGVYAYCSLNDTPSGKHAKEIIRHGDVESLSIYANDLKQHGSDVLHGMIRELSLVLAGANPGAFIEDVELAHGMFSDTEAIIYNGEVLEELCHSDEASEDEKKKKKPEEEDGNKEEKNNDSGDNSNENEEENMEDDKKKELSHANEGSEKTVKQIYDGMTDEQKLAVDAIVDTAVKQATGNNDDDDDNEGGDEMKHNVFDNGSQSAVLAHSIDFKEILGDAKKAGSLKDAVLAHAEEYEESVDDFIAHAYPQNEDGTTQRYGIANIDWLFPEARTLRPTPDWIKRETDWVAGVINGCHHTPFSRIKSMFADITEDEARAKGYIKGHDKIEEVFTLLKRTTTPQTIYKKQKLDRDDILDITDFDVVAWIKAEMRLMLDEEIARAVLIGDGRPTSSDDHISHEHVRPIWLDDNLYTIKKTVTAGADDDATARNIIKDAVKARIGYKGTGQPTLYTTDEWITNMLLLEDTNQHRLYKTMDELATAMRVSKIVPVPVMEGATRTVGEGASAKTYQLIGLIVNLQDYNIGADKGGAVSLFEDFDIDCNQEKYLIETRISGAMVKPKAAIALEMEVTGAAG